jgi:hypothetical protein
MAKIYVTPAQDLKVIDPATGKPLPSEGAEVVKSNWWMRRIRHGEVTLRKQTATAPKTPARKTQPRRRKPDTEE